MELFVDLGLGLLLYLQWSNCSRIVKIVVALVLPSDNQRGSMMSFSVDYS